MHGKARATAVQRPTAYMRCAARKFLFARSMGVAEEDLLLISQNTKREKGTKIQTMKA